MADKIMPPVHPGEILKEEFLVPLGIAANSLAIRIGVDPARVYEIIAGKRSVSLDTALRLGSFFGTSHHFWLGLQDEYELQCAEDNGLVERIQSEVRPLTSDERAAALAD